MSWFKSLIYIYTFRPNRPLEYMICIPAYGAVIGAWFGAWPMPLDWDRPWQVIILPVLIVAPVIIVLSHWSYSNLHFSCVPTWYLNNLFSQSQEWPICVSYCAIIGYLVGLVASWGVSIIHNRRHHYKGD